MGISFRWPPQEAGARLGVRSRRRPQAGPELAAKARHQGCKVLTVCLHTVLQIMFTTKDTKSTKGSEDKALNAILQPGDVEVDQQSGLDPGQLHICQQLRLVDALDFLNALQLDD
jgi:hypothetical protein